MKRNTQDLIAGLLALLAGILIIIAACLGDEFPKPLWLVTAVLQFINAALILKRYRDSGKDSETL